MALTPSHEPRTQEQAIAERTSTITAAQRALDRSLRTIEPRAVIAFQTPGHAPAGAPRWAANSSTAIPWAAQQTRADCVPLQSYRRDHSLASYRRAGALAAYCGRRCSHRSRDRARQKIAAASSSPTDSLIVEHAIARRFGRRSWGPCGRGVPPGLADAAIDREARAVAPVPLPWRPCSALRPVPLRVIAALPCVARVPQAPRRARAFAAGLVSCAGDRDAVARVSRRSSFFNPRPSIASFLPHVTTPPRPMRCPRSVVRFRSSYPPRGGKTPVRVTASRPRGSLARGCTAHTHSVAVSREPLAWHVAATLE